MFKFPKKIDNPFEKMSGLFCSIRTKITRHPSQNHPFLILDQQGLDIMLGGVLV